MAGMLAARVLADTFEQVTIIERHADRSVPPPALAQVFSEPARSQLERLFPGLSAELTADGAAIGVPVSQQGPTRPIPGAKRGSARLQFTQRFLERHLSRRLNTLDAIVMLSGCDAVGLVSDGQRCVGAHVLSRSRSAAALTVPADLLVDAMGTGSRLSLWLTELCGTQIPIEQQEVRLRCASRLYRLPKGALLDAAVVLDPSPPARCGAILMAVEADQHLGTIACARSHPPLDDDTFDDHLRAFASSDCADVLSAGEAVGPVSLFTTTPQLRRRFDRAHHLPSGVIALGSSLCSMDPRDGKGLAVAARHAAALHRLLGETYVETTASRSCLISRRYFDAVTGSLMADHSSTASSRT
jgi:2-polyprenyl-6-methoxyphenol hydroxylase-like FAD-dependent oxidoreductase